MVVGDGIDDEFVQFKLTGDMGEVRVNFVGCANDIARELRRRIKLAFEETAIPLTRTNQVQLTGTIATPQS